MRLAEFILKNIEPVLAEWELFARSVWPGEGSSPADLRDHAADILRATAIDMASAQTAAEQADKSKGDGGDSSSGLDGASEVHALGRVHSGFDLMTVIAEYRALRASVIRLWRESAPNPDCRDLEDLTRFNESIDQSLTRAVRRFTEQLDRSRQMFLAILGHDLRNPLNSITLSAQALSLTPHPDPDFAAMASQISVSAHAMGLMIHDLLDFTGASLGGAMPVSPAPMDLGCLCREVVDEMRAAHPGRTLRLSAEGHLAGNWDAPRLRQVISNLLGNALHHGSAATPVDLLLTEDGPRVHLTIHNQGLPIPPDILLTIFDPFVRGTTSDSQKKKQPGSLGLGLYIARAVVTAHHGTIDVTSSADAGTRFHVQLPRHFPAQSSEKPTPTRP